MRLSQSTEHSAKRYLLAALVAAAILYGSLYPFNFHVSEISGAGLRHLLSTWADPPQSRGDFLANILLYAPLGFSIGIARSRISSGHWSAVAALGMGAILSFSIEWTQYYDETRVSCLSDFYLNVAGSLLGWGASRSRFLNSVNVSVPGEGTAVFARILLLAWLAWRLFPYVPTIDLHKYWNSLKPVVLAPSLNPYDIFRYCTMWLSVALLFKSGIQPKYPLRSLVLVIVGFFFAKILIIDQLLTLPEICGAGMAVLLSRPLLERRPYVGIPFLALIFLVAVIGSRILPWQLSALPRPFQWVPFFGFLHGSLAVDLISFCEKFFLYGTLLLLLVRSGMPLGFATVLECVVLLGTSVLERFMVDRSGEITDAIMGLILALIYSFFRREYGEAAIGTRKRGRLAPSSFGDA